MVAADGAVVDDNIPGPESHGVPLPGISDAIQVDSQGCCRTFLTSNFFLPSVVPSEPLATALPLDEAPVVASFISTSAMVASGSGSGRGEGADGWAR